MECENFLTSLRYLAAAYDGTPDRVPLTPEVEATYEPHMRAYLTAQGKGYYVIRNAVQEVKQFLAAFHALHQTDPIPVVASPAPDVPTPPYARVAARDMCDTSPYKHQAWLTKSPYRLHPARWPADIRAHVETYRQMRRASLRASTLGNHLRDLDCYVSYLSLTGEQRLDYLHPDARKKLGLKKYHDDLQAIVTAPASPSWDALFTLGCLESFITWNAWRVQTPAEAKVKERPPSKPSALGVSLAHTLSYVANAFTRDEATALDRYRRELPQPRKIHNKQADYHRFEFAELEHVAHGLIREARAMHPNIYGGTKNPGGSIAIRFQTGVLLMLGWRHPCRARNWCEALFDANDPNQGNLRKVNGRWHFHFEGAELKVGSRRGQANVYDFTVDPEVVPYLEEWLKVWRPMLPHAAEDRHVFLGRGGAPLTRDVLRNRLSIHVYRFTGKRMFTHLLRTIFTSNLLSAGASVNAVAHGLNDNLLSVWQFYNELQAGKHEGEIQDLMGRALNGHGHGNAH
jgi:hypothetical protein